MGSIHKPTFSKPLPAGAELFRKRGEQWARWTDNRGRKQQARTTEAGDRIIRESACYVAKYRDAQGIVRTKGTGCRSADAARSVLHEIERKVELERAGVLTAGEVAMASHVDTPIAEHIAAFAAAQRAKGAHPDRIAADRRRVERVAEGQGWKRLGDMSAEAAAKWLGKEVAENRLTRTNRNEFAKSLRTFGNWCEATKRIIRTPFAHLESVTANPTRKPRALTADELRRLIWAARLRPLAEQGRRTVPKKSDPNRSPKSRATWTRERLTPANLAEAAKRGRENLADDPVRIEALEQEGRQRSLIYRTLALTGLRLGELRSLTAGAFEAHGGQAFLVLPAESEKAGRGAELPLRADLRAELEAWLSDRLKAAQAECRAAGGPIPAKLPADAPLIGVPEGLLRRFDKDREAAGIPKNDDRGRTVCLHGLRHTFASLLSAAGVPLRTAQEAMRHSTPVLTAKMYTDPRLLDTAGAIDSLPDLSMDGAGEAASADGAG